MSFERFKQAFDRDGFVIVPQLLDPADFDELAANLERYIRQVVPMLADSQAFYEDRARPETLKQLQHMGCDPFFRDYALHPRWSALAEALVGEEARGEQPEWFNKPAGASSATPPHQDNYYFNLQPPNVVTLWMALDPVDNENGCLRYVAGSHLGGFRIHGRSQVLGFSQGILDYGPDDERREVEIHLQPGDVVAHHGMTIHRAEANRSGARQRRAFALVYKGTSCRRDDEAFARYMAALKSQHTALGLATEKA
ncbi:MAG: phytanoyl-CoA dioxygenase family protein [Pirellulales bacterium]